MRKIWPILVIMLISCNLSAQEKANMAVLKSRISKFGQAEIRFKYSEREELSLIPRSIPVTRVKDNYAWAKISALALNDMHDFPYPYEIMENNYAKAVQSALSVEEAMNWDKYPSYQQYDTIVHKLAEDYPGICRLEVIGESVEGRKIFVLKISDNVDLDEDEPEVFYSSTMHGDELAGYVLMLRLAEHLLINSSNGGLEQQLIDSLEIWINPNANPDGTYAGGDTIVYSTRANANGIDMNRNFPDDEAAIIPPPGAPEISDMIGFLKDHRFVISANFHSGIELVNYPWDKWLEPRHADDAWFAKVSRNYADTVHFYSADQYYFDDYDNGVTHGASWYAVRGGRQDFVTFECQGREVTIELHEDDNTMASLLPVLWDDNYRSMLNYLANAFYGIHGKVVDNNTGLPLEAKIFIQGHDADSSHVYSGPLYGSFVRLINEGTYDIAVSSDGYHTIYLTNVQVNDFQQSALNISLLPDGTGIDDTIIDNIKIWPLPADEHIYVSLPEGTGTQCEISVYNINGSEVMKKLLYINPGNILHINVSSLLSGIYVLNINALGRKETLTGKFIKN
jgi:hypothetical protein